ncbi:hypothetical protein GIB67_009720 [Kingdonia uniflora]|uniref:Uncharacterized protein n=1 Tax=Kingdonia uniflora TaxID=39325 RepID=A0A7J7LB87_9MAGN|nr:hypothetical protein GIB67_009720 [Kingdonia uniflora]
MDVLNLSIGGPHYYLDLPFIEKEYGEDGNGHVRGFSGHINKTSVRVTTPLRKVIEREKSKNNQFADEVVSVRQEFEEKLEVEASKHRRLEERIGAFESRRVDMEFICTMLLQAMPLSLWPASCEMGDRVLRLIQNCRRSSTISGSSPWVFALLQKYVSQACLKSTSSDSS